MMRMSHSPSGSEIGVRGGHLPARARRRPPCRSSCQQAEILRAREWGHDKHLRFGATVVLPSKLYAKWIEEAVDIASMGASSRVTAENQKIDQPMMR